LVTLPQKRGCRCCELSVVGLFRIDSLSSSAVLSVSDLMATTLGTARGGCVGVSPWHKNLGRARRVLGLSDHMPPDGGFLVASARLDAPCPRSTSAWRRSPQRTPKASRRWSLARAVGASDSFDTTEPTYPEAVGLLYGPHCITAYSVATPAVRLCCESTTVPSLRLLLLLSGTSYTF